jgi:hypothetical protein
MSSNEKTENCEKIESRENTKSENRRKNYYEKNKERIKSKSLTEYYENLTEKRENARQYYHTVKGRNNELLLEKIDRMSDDERKALFRKMVERHANFIVSILEKN